jgi:hypothetical protein
MSKIAFSRQLSAVGNPRPTSIAHDGGEFENNTVNTKSKIRLTAES